MMIRQASEEKKAKKRNDFRVEGYILDKAPWETGFATQRNNRLPQAVDFGEYQSEDDNGDDNEYCK